MRRVFYRIAPIVLMIMTLITARPLKASAVSGVPTIISYQGRLTDSAGMLLGGVGTPYYFKFSIWTTATVGGGTKLWPSGTPGTMTITVTDGVFNAAIGDTGNGYPDALTYNFEDSDTVYLQIEVSPNGSVFETLGPRQRITSASTAINAKTLQGLLPGTGANNLLTLGASGEIALVSGGISTLGNVSLGTVSAGTWNGGLIGDVYLTKTGNWTGTFDGQEGSYYLNAANLINFSTPFATAFGTKTTDDLAEGSTNLYFTSTNFNTAFSGKNISLLNNDAGYITASSVPVLSVNGNIGDVVLTTSDLAEGLGLYFTDKRAQDSVGTILSGEFTYADTVPLISIASIASSKITGTKTSSYISDFNSSVQTVGDARYPEFTGSYNNPAWIASLAYSKLAGAPSNLSDFTNDAGYINSITSFDTDDLIEGSNLYFTDERAQDVIGSMLSGEFTYTDGTPLLEINSIAATKITGTKTSAFISDFSSAAQSALAGLYELPLTISTGLTRTSDTITNNLSIGVSGGQSVIGGTASGNNLTLSSTSNGTKGKIIFGSASAYDEASDRLGIGTVSPGYKLTVSTTTANDQTIRAVNSATTGTNYGGVFISNGSGATQNTGGYFTASGATTNYAVYSDGQANIVGGTLLTNGTNNALNITATEPSGTLGGHSYGAKVVVTSAGTTAEGWVRGAMFTQLAAGYTGAGTTVGAYFANTAAGTGTDPFVAGTYNAGFYGYTGSTTTGTNIGAKGAADGGSVNYGGFYQAVTAKNSATNIGILAQALNTGTSPVQVAGYFGLQATAPTYTSAALIADNGSTTSPIFLARDNGTAVFSIIDGGNVGIGTTPASTTKLDIVTTYTTTGFPLSIRNSGYFNAYFQGTDANNQASFYMDNNRGSFASYGGFLVGGSTSNLGNLFGVSRADRLFMFADGASNLGMYVGTINATSFNIGTNNINRMTVTSSGSITIANGTVVDQSAGTSITATMPSTMTAPTYGQLITVTGAGSSTQFSAAARILYNAGYTGSNANAAVSANNLSAGTGNNLYFNTAVAGVDGNLAVMGFSYATTTGMNVGIYEEAANGNVNIGMIGRAIQPKTSATNIGVIGQGRNTSTSPIQVGGWFSLAGSNPTFTSAALVADNGDQTSPIFLGRDNGSTIFSIIDGGNVGIGTAAPGSALTVVGDIALDKSSGVGTSILISNPKNIANFAQATFYPAAGTNVNSTFSVIPKGTGVTGNRAQISLFGTDFIADSTNYEFLSLRSTGTEYTLATGKAGTGTSRPLMLAAGFASDGTTNANQLYLATNGYVGIGTSSPGYLLDVQIPSTGVNQPVARFKNNVAGSNTTFALDSLSTKNSNFQFNNNAVAKWYVGNDGSNDRYRILNSDANSNAEVFTILQNGNVGIGTTTPSTTLHIKTTSVASSAETLAKFEVSDASDYFSIFNNTSANANFDPTFKGYTTRSGGYPLGFIGSVLDAQDTGTVPLITFQGRKDSGVAVVNRDLFDFANYGTSVLRIKANGNVGIGTTTPAYKLDIAVNAASDGVRVVNSLNSGFPAFVSVNNAAQTASYGITGSTYPVYGALNPSNTILYSTVDQVFMADGASSVIKFATGGNTERMRIAANGNVGINTTNPANAKLEIVGGSLSSGVAGLQLTGTLVSTGSIQYGANFQITGSGSGSAVQAGINFRLLAGYTGAATTIGGSFVNASAGTGNSFNLSSGVTAPTGNGGGVYYAYGTTTGLNYGVFGEAENGNINIGLIGKATILKNSATNIGITGFGLNTGTSPIQIGGYFGLQNSTPTFTSAALISDNGSTTSPIFLARDNGTAVFSIIDGGNVGIAMTPTYRLDVTGDAADTTVMRISTTSGNACTFSTITGSFSCASDSRLKHDIASIDATDALTKLSALNPVLYRYNWQTSSDPLIAGFVAQEFESIFPDLVKTDPITGYKSLSYAPLMPYVISAIQDMNLKVAKLPIYQDQTMMDRLSAFWDGIATSGHAVVEKMTTHELCVDDVCVTRDQFLHMVQQSGQASTTPAPTPNAEAPDPVVEETPAQPEAVVETPLEEPAPVVEATP